MVSSVQARAQFSSIRIRMLSFALLSPHSLAVMARMEGEMHIETDVDTFLAGQVDRLRVIAFALRGMAGDAGGAGAESKVLHASAGELEAVARRLDSVREHLCRSCKVLEVEESLRIGGE